MVLRVVGWDVNVCSAESRHTNVVQLFQKYDFMSFFTRALLLLKTTYLVFPSSPKKETYVLTNTKFVQANMFQNRW